MGLIITSQEAVFWHLNMTSHFLFTRELKTNVGFIKDLEEMAWGEYIISFVLGITGEPELHISGVGDGVKFAQEDEPTNELLGYLDRISLATQSQIELGHNAAVFQSGRGTERYVTFWHHKESAHVGNSIDEDNIANIQTFLAQQTNEKSSVALRWLRRAINTRHQYEKFFFLVLAVESLAEDLESWPKCEGGCIIEECKAGHKVTSFRKTNAAEIKKILGGNLYDKIYGSRMRADLFHGRFIDEEDCGAFYHDLYGRVIRHVIDKEGLVLKGLVGQPHDAVQHSECKIKLKYKTNYSKEDIPRDHPPIKDLRRWMDGFNANANKKPFPPFFIHHSRFFEVAGSEDKTSPI